VQQRHRELTTLRGLSSNPAASDPNYIPNCKEPTILAPSVSRLCKWIKDSAGVLTKLLLLANVSENPGDRGFDTF